MENKKSNSLTKDKLTYINSNGIRLIVYHLKDDLPPIEDSADNEVILFARENDMIKLYRQMCIYWEAMGFVVTERIE